MHWGWWLLILGGVAAVIFWLNRRFDRKDDTPDELPLPHTFGPPPPPPAAGGRVTDAPPIGGRSVRRVVLDDPGVRPEIDLGYRIDGQRSIGSIDEITNWSPLYGSTPAKPADDDSGGGS